MKKLRKYLLNLLIAMTLLLFVACASNKYSGAGWFQQGVNHLEENRVAAAFDCFEKSAQAGYPRGMHAVGVCYYAGIYVDKNYSYSVSYFKRAASMGCDRSNEFLAICYWNGLGVARDRTLAKQYARAAGTHGEKLLKEMAEIEAREANSSGWEVLLGSFALGFLEGFLSTYEW